MTNKLLVTACTINPHEAKCFEKLSISELKILEDNSVRIHYKKKEVICKQGSFVSHVMFVEEGLVKVFIEDGQNCLVLKMIPRGSLLGLSSLSEDHNTYQYSAMAYIDTTVKQIDIRAFNQLLKENADFAKEVIDIFCANSVQVYGRFFCLTHKQAYGRLADILLCLSERVFKQSEFHLPLSRRDLAELSGMSQETVIRMLKKFSEDGLIRMDGKSLKINDYTRLQRISDTG